MLSLYCRTQNTCFVIICSAEDLLTLNSNKLRMVCKVDGNPQLDSRDWSMYSNILNSKFDGDCQLLCSDIAPTFTVGSSPMGHLTVT